jgi:hypothetical protein
VALRRNLLCFVTGALIALAVVLVLRERGDGTPGAAAVETPALVRTTATTAAIARDTRLHGGAKWRPSGRRKARGGGGSAGGAEQRSSSATPERAAAAAASAGTKRPTRTTTPSEDEARSDDGGDLPPAEDPGATEPDAGAGAGAGDTSGQPTEPTAPSSDTSGSTGATTPSGATGGSGVTIPNPATPDASIGSGG